MTEETRALPARRALTDDVYDAVTALLLDGVIPPGSRANIEAIARELDVSPTPVREALARLESEGLVSKRAHQGYTAAALLDERGLADLFHVRLLLEPDAAALAAVRRSSAAVAALREAIADMRSETSGGTLGHERFERYRAFAAADAILHATIAGASGNPVLGDAITRLRPHLHQYRLYLDVGIADATNDEHEAIVDAIERRDVDAAAAAMRTHLDRSRARARAHLDEA